jgi:hypothetical protein
MCSIGEKDPLDGFKWDEREEERMEKLRKQLFPSRTRSTVSRGSQYTVFKVLLAALVIIAPAIYVATKVRQRAKRP